MWVCTIHRIKCIRKEFFLICTIRMAHDGSSVVICSSFFVVDFNWIGEGSSSDLLWHSVHVFVLFYCVFLRREWEGPISGIGRG